MKLRIIFKIGAILVGMSSYSQSFDYLSVRDSITSLNCTKTDSATVVTALERLDEIDSNSINSNLNLYLTDLANVYWVNAVRTKDNSWNYMSIKVFRQLLRLEPENYSAWWNMGCILVKLQLCDEAIEAKKQYLKYAPAEHVETMQPDRMFEKCM